MCSFKIIILPFTAASFALQSHWALRTFCASQWFRILWIRNCIYFSHHLGNYILIRFNCVFSHVIERGWLGDRAYLVVCANRCSQFAFHHNGIDQLANLAKCLFLMQL